MSDRMVRADATRLAWLATIERHRHDRDAPGSAEYWSPRLDTASRDEIRAIQDDKIAAVAPFLYENSEFYRRRFDRLGLVPSDMRNVDDLVAKWPVVDKLRDGRGRGGASALRHLYGHDRRGVGRARLDDVLLLRHAPARRACSATPTSIASYGRGPTRARCKPWIFATATRCS